MIFEFSLSQVYRHFLRVESAFAQLRRLISNKSPESYQAALLLFENLSEFLLRVDIKNELIKELEIQANHYQKLQDNPAVDKVKLDNFLNQLKKLHHWAINFHGKIGDSLRRDPFLSTVSSKQSLNTGVISADSPELAVFGFQEPVFQAQHFKRWLEMLEGLEKSVSVILRLTRELSSFTAVEAPIGDYLVDKLPSSTNLIRIKLDDKLVFPEVSASKHCASIHFYRLDSELLKTKFRDKIAFKIALCGWR